MGRMSLRKWAILLPTVLDMFPKHWMSVKESALLRDFFMRSISWLQTCYSYLELRITARAPMQLVAFLRRLWRS